MHNKNFIKDNLHQLAISKRLLTPGPKRILALDGGGIRGAISLGYLSEIERILRERFKNPNLVLSDYFDLIGGTSTGSIIATLLALGYSVADIEKKYISLGGVIFSQLKYKWAVGFISYFMPAKFSEKPLENALEEVLGTKTLSSPDLKTGLCIFCKRADTYTPYVFHNHPRGVYYEENKGILLKDLVRASSAAPSYFTSKQLSIGNKSSIFIDGGVSSYNNPSLMLFMIATLKGYPFQWKKGKENLFLISIGTGTYRPKIESKGFDKLLKKRSIFWAKDIPDLFMMDATILNQMLLQTISQPEKPWKINDEAGDLEDDRIIDEPLLSYRRYNVLLEKNALQSLGYSFDEKTLESLREMSNGFNVGLLSEISKKASLDAVKDSHLPSDFDQGLSFSKPTILDQKNCLAKFLPLINTVGSTYEKFGTIEAKIARVEEKVTSITKYGVETINKAIPGDYIVTNKTTSSKEKYIVKPNKFPSRYELIKNIDDNTALYKPIGRVKAIQLDRNILDRLNLTDHFEIIPDWNESQYVSKGDYIVCPPDESEIYRIGYDEFLETYKKD